MRLIDDACSGDAHRGVCRSESECLATDRCRHSIAGLVDRRRKVGNVIGGVSQAQGNRVGLAVGIHDVEGAGERIGGTGTNCQLAYGACSIVDEIRRSGPTPIPCPVMMIPVSLPVPFPSTDARASATAAVPAWDAVPKLAFRPRPAPLMALISPCAVFAYARMGASNGNRCRCRHSRAIRGLGHVIDHDGCAATAAVEGIRKGCIRRHPWTGR